MIGNLKTQQYNSIHENPLVEAYDMIAQQNFELQLQLFNFDGHFSQS